MTIRVLAISGSLRKNSSNRKALQIAKRFASELGAEVSEFDLKAMPLPIYDGDIEEEGTPPAVQQFRDAVKNTDVLLIASPEYNFTIPGGLKNAFDWGSRQGNAFDGKVAAIFGVSNGPRGTVRMQPDFYKVFSTLNVMHVPQPQVAIAFGDEAFNVDGSLKDKQMEERLKTLVQKTLEFTQKIKN